MSTVEELLVRDIAAVTGGVIVTESDLQEARSALDDRIEQGHRRDRVRTAAMAAAAAAVVAAGVTAFLTLGGDEEPSRLAAPAPSTADPDASYLTGSPPSAELVDGVWRLDNGGTVVKFDEDGTVRFDNRGALFSHPAATGTYTIDGDVITVTTTGESTCSGAELSVRASVVEPGSIRFVRSATSGSCSLLPVGRGALERVLPVSKAMAELSFAEDTGWQPASDETLLYGVWLAQGGGHLLEMDRGGAYVVANGSGELIDQGQWTLRGGDLTLASSVGSASCSDGARLVLSAVEWVNPGTNAVRGEVTRNDCGGAWTPPVWILIPDDGN